MSLTYEKIAGRIDHALLLPTMTTAEMLAGCQLARLYEVASVCIKPYAVSLAVEALRGSSVRVGTVVGFPHGGSSPRIKVAEAVEALEAGAVEIDMVVNIGDVKSGHWDRVEQEIREVMVATHNRGGLLKVIFETGYLDEPEKIQLCQICSEVGVDFVKTSTGFGTGGATDEDLALMNLHTSKEVAVKASGGIRDLATAIRFVDRGSKRLGLSKTAEILDELSGRLGITGRDVSRETTTNSEAAQSTY